MDNLTLQSVANLVVFVMPGYFAIRVYSSIFAKDDKDFAKLLVESAAFSLIIVSLFNLAWRYIYQHPLPVVTQASYVLSLLVFSVLCGWFFAYLRKWEPVKRAGRLLGVPAPDEDFIRTQFKKLRDSGIVSVTLKSGSVFSGTPQGGSKVRSAHPRQYYFNDVAWYNKKTHKWEKRSGSIIVDLSEVDYLETATALPRD